MTGFGTPLIDTRPAWATVINCGLVACVGAFVGGVPAGAQDTTSGELVSTEEATALNLNCRPLVRAFVPEEYIHRSEDGRTDTIQMADVMGPEIGMSNGCSVRLLTFSKPGKTQKD